MSQTLSIEMPDEVLLAMQKDPVSLAAEMRVAAAAKWYESGMLSQARAAEAAGLSRAAFISELARFGVSPCQETSHEILEAVKQHST
ncbi:MAG: UPF0175 family protein [Limisphaerales bacterium]